ELATRFNRSISIGDLTSSLVSQGFKEPRIVMAEGNRAYITLAGTGQGRTLNDAERNSVEGMIRDKGGMVEQTNVVSGTISGELIKGAFLSVIYASLLIVLYLAIRFSIPN